MKKKLFRFNSEKFFLLVLFIAIVFLIPDSVIADYEPNDTLEDPNHAGEGIYSGTLGYDENDTADCYRIRVPPYESLKVFLEKTDGGNNRITLSLFGHVKDVQEFEGGHTIHVDDPGEVKSDILDLGGDNDDYYRMFLKLTGVGSYNLRIEFIEEESGFSFPTCGIAIVLVGIVLISCIASVIIKRNI